MEKAMNTRMGIKAKNCLIAAALIAASMACSRSGDMEGGGEPPYVVEDWEVNPDTFKTRPDSSWQATHEDSVRFGLI